eukprot:5573530-Pleurochrysis_carterae.AAC.1
MSQLKKHARRALLVRERLRSPSQASAAQKCGKLMHIEKRHTKAAKSGAKEKPSRLKLSGLHVL